MKTIKPTSRRNFLLTAGLGGAGVAAAVVTGTKSLAKGAKTAATEGQASGYHASAHVLKYYETTKV
jgi:nitrous oxide reductase